MEEKSKILFVDDEKNFLDGLRLMLRPHRKEWAMTFVTSVDEAMAHLKKEAVDAVISDVEMPGKNGFDLLEGLRKSKKFSNLPVIILTGSADSDYKSRALDHGATDLLNKPVSIHDLIARIRNVLRLKSYQDRLRNQNIILDKKIRERTIELEVAHRSLLLRLAKAGEFRDEETGDHVLRVALCCKLLAQTADLPENEVESILITSPLHDVGKIGIPDAVLLKPGRLDPEERKIVETHSEIGAAILLENPKFLPVFFGILAPLIESSPSLVEDPLREKAAEIALSHHEKWDGSGYPKGLREDAIPIAGRIAAITDVYDALRAKRPYKEPFSVEKSRGIIQEGAGKHFDPMLVEVFLEIHDEFEAIISGYHD